MEPHDRYRRRVGYSLLLFAGLAFGGIQVVYLLFRLGIVNIPIVGAELAFGKSPLVFIPGILAVLGIWLIASSGKMK